MEASDLDRMLSASVLRLRMHAPFFASLALFARFRPASDVPTACTDGRDVYYNPDYFRSLPARQLDAVVLHEVLHAALLHAVRRGLRDPFRWNYAADVVVNGVVAQQSFAQLPEGCVREPKLEDKSVEEIYELIADKAFEQCPRCLRAMAGPDEAGALQRRVADVEAYWREAVRHAEAVARLSHGTLPAGADRIVQEVAAPQIDWRAALWRFLVRTPTDFADFDRRFLSRGLYLEALTGESVRVDIGVDTSGSIGPQQLAQFLAEVRGIVRSYPHIRARLFYADAALYGPHELDADVECPAPRGGGGTSFAPFFDYLEADGAFNDGGVCVYLTDGEGQFPQRAPSGPVLWVVTPGGMRAEHFPFGEVVRLLSE